MSLSKAMDGANKQEEYKPTEEYEEEFRDPRVDISLTDSTELWLIQWPYKQTPDLDGKEVSLKLHESGWLGTVEDSSGRVYDMLNLDTQEPDATVFVTSTSEPIVGKISRRVSLVHFPEPKELEALNSKRQLYQTSSGSSHRFATPSRSRMTNSQSTWGRPVPSHSSRQKSSMTDFEEPSKHSKKRRVHEPNFSTDRSTLDSVGRHSGATFSGSSQHSRQGTSNKKVKVEE